jgi:hypothetical protein
MRLLLPVLGIVVALALSGVVIERPTSVEAGTARRMDIADMVDAADLVVRAEVVSARARVGARGLIETEYVLSVSHTFWGDPLTTRVVRLPGGVLPDGRGLLLAGMPRLEEREDVLLFLSNASASGIRMPIGLAQGKFAVETLPNGATRLLRDQTGLAIANPITGAIEPGPGASIHFYAAIVAEIEAAVSTRVARLNELATGAARSKDE